MTEAAILDKLSALAHPLRLRTFRVLMSAGPDGLPAGEIAGTLGTPRSTLSTHLAQLERSGLLVARRERQQIIYSVDCAGSRDLIDFLVNDCCGGRPDICGFRPVAYEVDEPAAAAATVSLSLLDARRARRRREPEDGKLAKEPFNVLFLCMANSARSIFAEALLARHGRGRFRAFSAGSTPAGRVHPRALEVLERNNYLTQDLRSKDWNEFAQPGAPHMDFVFTVCDKAAGELCPVWPGQPMTAHWGIVDPAAAEGADWEIRAAFTQAFRELQNRISIFVNLPFDSLDRLKLQERLDAIGRVTPADRPALATARE